MEFHEFLRKMRFFYGNKYRKDKKETVPEFLQTLFDADTDFQDFDENNPIESSDGSTEKKIYSGTRPLPENIAQDTIQRIKDLKFKKFLELENEDTITALCDSFRNVCPDIDEDNYVEEITKLFHRFLENAVTGIPILEEETFNSKKTILANEEHFRCPIPNCGTSLIDKKDDESYISGEIIVVDKNSSKRDCDNLLLLCPKCYSPLSKKISIEDSKLLKQIKLKILNEKKADNILSQDFVDDGIRLVLTKIPMIDVSEKIDDSFDPKHIYQKIPSTEKMLIRKVKNNNDDYFVDIKKLSIELSRENKFDYDLFGDQIKLKYKQLKKLGFSHSQIYEKFVAWLINETEAEREACEAVVSYHIQQCDIFEEL